MLTGARFRPRGFVGFAAYPRSDASVKGEQVLAHRGILPGPAEDSEGLAETPSSERSMRRSDTRLRCFLLLIHGAAQSKPLADGTERGRQTGDPSKHFTVSSQLNATDRAEYKPPSDGGSPRPPLPEHGIEVRFGLPALLEQRSEERLVGNLGVAV
jgi:hypothetical protein